MNRRERRIDAKRGKTADREAIARANARLRIAMDAVYKKTDADNEAHKPKEVTCRKGCAACCKQLVYISLPEAGYIVLREEAALKKALPTLQRQQALLETFAERFAEGEVSLNPAARQQMHEEWFRLNEQCAFLDSNNECSIYESRPHTCRSYFVVSDPVNCGNEGTGEILAWFSPPHVGGYAELAAVNQAMTGNPKMFFAMTTILLDLIK